MIYLQISLILLCAILWRLGGWDKAKWAGFRDVLIPVINFFYFGFTTNWLIGFLTAGATNSIRMGYGAYDPEHDDKPSWLAKITRDREGSIIRGIYGAVTAIAIGLFPAIHSHNWGFYAGYILFNASLEVILNRAKANVWPTEILNGAGRALVVFL